MNLRDLLAELRGNILRDVSTATSNPAEGYLWSDASLVRYIDDAERKFARLTHCLRDNATPEVVEIAVSPDVTEYPLHDSVVEVLSCSCNGVPLRRAGNAQFAGSPVDKALFTGNYLHERNTPLWFSTDESVRVLRLMPIPDAEYTLRLRVARLPLRHLVSTDLTASPEIPEDYHLDLLEWAAWRALRNHDVDAENMNKASMHKKRFMDAVDEVRAAAKRLMLEPIQFAVNARTY